MIEDIDILNDPLNASEESSTSISGNVIKWGPTHFVAVIALRPDVKEEAIVGLLDQVLLSLGGLTQKTTRSVIPSSSGATAALPTITADNHGDGPWAAIKIQIGVNSEYFRVALLEVTPSSALGLGSLLTSALTPFKEFAHRLAKHLCSALTEEHWTLSQLDSICQEQAETVLDLPFVLDLIAVSMHLMNQRIAIGVERADNILHSAESQCARLMTLLKPTYQRAGLSLPPIPVSKSISAYPLNLLRPSLRDACTVDQARMLLLMSRKAFRELLQMEGEEAPASVAQHVAAIAATICKELESWGDEESNIRLERKLAQMRDRLAALNGFRSKLVLTLHERFRSSSSNGMAGGLLSWLSGSSADDRHHAAAVEAFPFLGHGEPVIYDTPATLPIEGSKGVFFVTLGHLLFQGTTGMMRSPVTKVWPFRALRRVALLSPESAAAAAMESSANTAAAPTAGLEGVFWEDNGGVETVVVAADITPHLHHRLFDLLNLILRERLYLSLDSNHAAPPSAGSEVQTSATIASSTTMELQPAQIASAHSKSDVEGGERDLSDLLRELENLEHIEGALEVVTFRSPPPAPLAVSQPAAPQSIAAPAPPVPPLASTPTGSVNAAAASISSAATSSTSPAEDKPKKTMGANIQKFLQQQQSKKSQNN